MILSIVLFLVMFYDALALLLLPSTVTVITTPDGSVARLVVDACAITVTMYALYSCGLKSIDNRWLLILPLVVILSHFNSPNIKFDSTFMPNDMAIYNYKPMLDGLLLLFFMFAVCSIKVDIRKVYCTLVIIAAIYSVYIILQRFGFDQLYRPAGQLLHHESRHPEAGGFLSQPVFASAFIAITMPLALRLKRYFIVILCFAGILATGNRSALFIAVLGCLAYYKTTSKLALGAAVGYILFLVFSPVYWIQSTYKFIVPDERFMTWPFIIRDMVHPIFPGSSCHILTGFGLGAFSVIFPFYNHSGFYQAHNEYLEFFFASGLVGVACLVMAILDFIKKQNCDHCLLISILAALGLAMTNAIWHIAQLAFLTAFLVGLAYNQTRSRYELVRSGT